MTRVDDLRRALRGKALSIPSDIWESATADDGGGLELAPLMAAMLAVMEYEWAWRDAMCAP